MKKMVRKELVLGVVGAVTLAVSQVALSQNAGTTYIAETASVMGACGKLFDIDANAAELTAPQRAAIIQKNLDYAIIHAKNRAPNAVTVGIINRNPVVMFDGFHIATADGNSAARHNVTQMQLAEQWADKIRFCLADAAAMDRYLSQLTGKFKTVSVLPREERIAYARAGLAMPVKLLTEVDNLTAQLGEPVEFQLTSDVPLPTSFTGSQYEAYLPAGSVALGHLSDASWSYLGKGTLTFRMDQLRTPDGELIPIKAHIVGAADSWVAYAPNPQTTVEVGTIAGTKLTATEGLLAAKGNVCGGWSGNPVEGFGTPFNRMLLSRRTDLVINAGSPMTMQLHAPTVVSICTNCGGGNAVAVTTGTPIAIGGTGPD